MWPYRASRAGAYSGLPGFSRLDLSPQYLIDLHQSLLPLLLLLSTAITNSTTRTTAPPHNGSAATQTRQRTPIATHKANTILLCSRIRLRIRLNRRLRIRVLISPSSLS